jgi:L-cysteine desulfidase
MNFADYLSAEWRPSLGCTEPAAIAYAASMAASLQRGEVRLVRLVCDARTYKNCHSVGIPNSGQRTGLLWTLAIGAHLPDHSLGLRCFEQTDVFLDVVDDHPLRLDPGIIPEGVDG